MKTIRSSVPNAMEDFNTNMKTIVINGITFTDQPPTKEGWWLHAYENQSVPVTTSIRSYKGKFWASWYGGSLHEITGFWHELIPREVFAEEVEKAFEEGIEFGTGAYGSWKESRAKRVAEGTEP